MFVARITSGVASASSARKIVRLRSRSSSAASMTRSASAPSPSRRGDVTEPVDARVDPGIGSVGVRARASPRGAPGRRGPAQRRARWRSGPRRGARPRRPPRARPGRCRRPSSRRPTMPTIVTPTSSPRTAAGTRGSRTGSGTASGRRRCPSRRPPSAQYGQRTSAGVGRRGDAGPLQRRATRPA